jgi:succinate dehydrogenase / fumarate reductase membrane anchor subunit
MDMRTPLGKVRGLGSAKDGTDHFWRQRVTAVDNIPLIAFFIGFCSLWRCSYADVVGALAIRSLPWSWASSSFPASSDV